MGILIAAIITTIVSIGVVGLFIRNVQSAPRWLLVFAFLTALPAQPVAYYYIREPLHAFLTQWLGTGALLGAIALFYAPVIEEPAKWLSLVFPSLRRAMKPENAVAVALAVGLGFGVGEIWFIAERLFRSPQIAALPFWQFGGFLLERVQVCLLHGAFIALLFKRFAEGKSLWPAALLGMALHFALNFPIYLAALNIPPLGRQLWPLALLGWVLLATLLAVLWVMRLAANTHRRDKAGRG